MKKNEENEKHEKIKILNVKNEKWKKWKNDKQKMKKKKKWTKMMSNEKWRNWLHAQNPSTISIIYLFSECQQPVLGGYRFSGEKVAIFIGRETKTHILPTEINEKSLRSAPLTIIILLE